MINHDHRSIGQITNRLMGSRPSFTRAVRAHPRPPRQDAARAKDHSGSAPALAANAPPDKAPNRSSAVAPEEASRFAPIARRSRCPHLPTWLSWIVRSISREPAADSKSPARAGHVRASSGHGNRPELQFAQNKTRHDQRATEKSGRTKVGNSSIDDHVGVDDQRFMLGRLASEAHIGNDERELVPVAPHREHHPEVTKSAVNNSTDRPLNRFRLIARICEALRRFAKRRPSISPKVADENARRENPFKSRSTRTTISPSKNTYEQTWDRLFEQFRGNQGANHSAKGHE